LVQDPALSVRGAAVQALEAVAAEAPEAVQSLAAALDDPSAVVRVRAAGALGRLGKKAAAAALPALARRRTDPDRHVRAAVAEALRVIDAPPPARPNPGPF
jgi:HEAT repeat protein